jgi:hypothetical protein
MPTFHYIVDDEPQETTAHVLTPAQILSNAGIETESHYLVQIEGDQEVSYENEPEKTIHMHEKMKFIAPSRKPTPVS